jgi:uncharacterized Zn finger protein
MRHLDGNVLAGPLSEVFDADMTLAVADCLGCGDESVLARAMVYADARGYVARCSACGDVLMLVLRTPSGTHVELVGVEHVRLPG